MTKPRIEIPTAFLTCCPYANLARAMLTLSLLMSTCCGPSPLLAQGRPNIIVINLDDADTDLLRPEIRQKHLPNIDKLANRSLEFEQCHITTPICGPSRICLYRGQYAHRTGIRTNRSGFEISNGFQGGFKKFMEYGMKDDHFGSWMRDTGYRTMMVGKYANGRHFPRDIVGWDDFCISFGGRYYGTYVFSTRDKPAKHPKTLDPGVYRTDFESEEIHEFLQNHQNARKHQPFFLYYASMAPHRPPVNSPMVKKELRQAVPELPIPNTPDLIEADVSDKPTDLQLDPLSTAQLNELHEKNRKRLISLISVDQLVGKLITQLESNKQLDNTYIFLTSDHGYSLGHNQQIGKCLPFHRITAVPLFVSGPGISHDKTRHLVSHIDIAPTLLDIAQLGTNEQISKPKITFDGKSLLPICNNPKRVPLDSFRNELLIEHWESFNRLSTQIPAVYSSMRRIDSIYTEWANGDIEYYDLAKDPYQLDNLSSRLDENQRIQMAKDLRSLKTGMPLPLPTIKKKDYVSGSKFQLSGYAEDGNAVKKAEIQIYSKAKKQWLDESGSWNSKPQFLETRLSNPGGLICKWSFERKIRGLSHHEELVIRIRATNRSGKSAISSPAISIVDNKAPDTVIESIRRINRPGPNAMIIGLCLEELKIKKIVVSVQNQETKEFWNGKHWSGTPATIERMLLKRRWHLKLNLPEGSYLFRAWSVDAGGNVDSTPAEQGFRMTIK